MGVLWLGLAVWRTVAAETSQLAVLLVVGMINLAAVLRREIVVVVEVLVDPALGVAHSAASSVAASSAGASSAAASSAGASSALAMFSSIVMWMHTIQGGPYVFGAGLLGVLFTMFSWWTDVIREAHGGDRRGHKAVQ